MVSKDATVKIDPGSLNRYITFINRKDSEALVLPRLNGFEFLIRFTVSQVQRWLKQGNI